MAAVEIKHQKHTQEEEKPVVIRGTKTRKHTWTKVDLYSSRTSLGFGVTSSLKNLIRKLNNC